MTNEREKSLAGLKALGLDALTDGISAEYAAKLLAFADWMPDESERLKALLAAGDMPALMARMNDLRDALDAISVAQLSQSCASLVNLAPLILAGADGRQAFEARLFYFLSVVTELSMDIHMAMQRETPAPPPPVYAVQGAQRSVLAVDDMPQILSALKLVFADTRFKFTGVNSAAAALRYISTHTPDLFLLDIDMPDMNGYELAEVIRRRGTHRAPIVFLTGCAKKEYVQMAIQAGASDFIVKPVNKERVLEKIEKYI